MSPSIRPIRSKSLSQEESFLIIFQNFLKFKNSLIYDTKNF
jgi:hypothetical protein